MRKLEDGLSTKSIQRIFVEQLGNSEPLTVSTLYDGADNELQQLDSFDANLILLKQTWFFRCKLELSDMKTW